MRNSDMLAGYITKNIRGKGSHSKGKPKAWKGCGLSSVPFSRMLMQHIYRKQAAVKIIGIIAAGWMQTLQCSKCIAIGQHQYATTTNCQAPVLHMMFYAVTYSFVRSGVVRVSQGWNQCHQKLCTILSDQPTMT